MKITKKDINVRHMDIDVYNLAFSFSRKHRRLSNMRLGMRKDSHSLTQLAVDIIPQMERTFWMIVRKIRVGLGDVHEQ